MISGRERLVLVQRLCNEVSEVFIDGTLNVVQTFLKCTIHMDYAMCIFLGSYYCRKDQFTIACGVLQYVIVIEWVVRL